MPLILSSEAGPLVARAQLALGLSQQQLGDMLGVSRRTVIRWNKGSAPTRDDVLTLAKAVHATHPELASELAKAPGTRLHEIGLAPLPVAPNPLAKELAIDSIVCAAAEAALSTPQAARGGLLAALDRAKALGVTSEELRTALRK
jgi:transcriptional regulator with XRE-family HTH domain